ncbi:MAG: GIY-YIG nuclease family protein [Paludibacteraceae bacterium]|nr:GIY-YIG nuclease family protein [Paludibacteraceae bacterium]
MDKDYIISIQDLLKGWNRNSDFDNVNESRIKLVRHSSDVQPDSFIYNKYKGSVYKLYRTDYALFKEWQSEQSDSKMKNVDYLVVFLAEEGCECRFIGVYRNYGPKRAIGNGVSEYAIEEVEGFEGLKDKVVIDWGKGTLSWMQNWQSTKNVRRIDQVNTGDDIPYFIRYEDVILSFSQLQKVVEDKEWKSKLESLNCVYMILDKETGKQYVGVTYKDMKPGIKNGILGRWTEYAKTGHGNNKLLVALLAEKGISYANQNFQWTILETLPLNVTPKVAIDRESLYKKKFGTREHGYNEN